VRKQLRAFALISVLVLCLSASGFAEALPGVEVLLRDHAGELNGKRLGLLTNPTGVDRRLNHTIDLIRAIPGARLARLFAPEHGVRGGYYAGEKVDETKDPISGIPIASLYGRTRRPTPEMLKDLDIVLYDIQDVGNRHYTFISSLAYMMEECEKAGVAVWVLDRPEPMGGNIVGGAMLNAGLITFIGIHTIPEVYGMTPGEFARMYQAEKTPKLDLRVVPLEGWKRGMNYGALGWVWVSPSQHIPRWESCYYYSITGTIGELGRVSEGVGVPLPFELLGAPFVDGVRLAKELNARSLPGVVFRPATFSPRYGRFQGKSCQGVQIHITDYSKVNPPVVATELMAALNRLYADQKIFSNLSEGNLFLPALGDPALADHLADGGNPLDHQKRINSELEKFLTRRTKYLLYQ
jgi:uncharacterized protein YbbC (DUF1343 family)